MIWSKEETLSRVEMEKLQLARLQETVARVYEKVPYYRAKMDEMGVKPQDIQSLADLQKLPFTVHFGGEKTTLLPESMLMSAQRKNGMQSAAIGIR